MYLYYYCAENGLRFFFNACSISEQKHLMVEWHLWEVVLWGTSQCRDSCSSPRASAGVINALKFTSACQIGLVCVQIALLPEMRLRHFLRGFHTCCGGVQLIEEFLLLISQKLSAVSADVSAFEMPGRLKRVLLTDRHHSVFVFKISGTPWSARDVWRD